MRTKANTTDSFQPESHDLNSRKFLLTIFCVIILIGMALGSALIESLQIVFPTFVGGILGILSLYFTGNVMHRYVSNRTMNVHNTIEHHSSEEEEQH